MRNYPLRNSRLLTAIMILLIHGTGGAQPDDEPTSIESPYFFIQNEGISADQFPLLSTKVNVSITGPVADVVVTQTYKNNGKVPIEATYVFPASTRAAVHDLQMIIGERIIRAEIKEKEKARSEYKAARDEGKRATLLEQFRPNVFQMNVANLMPGDLIQVVLKYNELIIPENQDYTYVFPTVVGPRFVSHKHRGADESFAANPYLPENAINPHQFDIEVNISLPVPVQAVSSPSHDLDFNFKNKNKASARLSPEETNGGNRDFILIYRMSGESIGGGTLLYEHDDEKFFLTTIEPPQMVGATKVLPREYIFVLDVSGSMFGFPIETTKHLVKSLVQQLKPTDLFNVMLFAGGNSMLSPLSVPATEMNVNRAFSLIDQLEGSGSTEIIPALNRIYSLPKNQTNLSRSIVIVSDGYISVEPEVFDLISKNSSQGNVFAFGIGSGVNRYLIEGMAHAGRGEAFIVTKPEMALEAADRFRKYIQTPVLTNIKVGFQGFDAYDIVPAVIPDLMAERPIYIFGKYRSEPNGSISLSGDLANEKYHQKISINAQQKNDDHAPIRFLWAREMIRQHHDFLKLMADQDRIASVTALGLKYHLLTDYTSFIAIDETEKVNADGSVTRVRQPLPLPENVSNYAVGFDMGMEGISPAQLSSGKVSIAPVVISEVDQSLKNSLEKSLSDELQHWSDPAQYHGKKMKIVFGENMTDLIVTIDGAVVSEKMRKSMIMVFMSMKAKWKPGDFLLVKFCPGMDLPPVRLK